MNFVVLSSSRGTTFQSVIEALQSGALTATCLGLVADSPERGCIEKAKAAGLPVRIVGKVKGEPREEYDRRLDAELRAMGANEQTIIAAIGWMFVLSPCFVRTWHNRILNVHPALLPKYPGAHAHEEVLAAHEKETGMTIHVIDEGVDTGPILLQKRCPVLPDDTHDALKERVQELEKEWYPKVLQMIEEGEVQLPMNTEGEKKRK
ncbi:MAG: phosphoribosylglycinamide formyltransferase [Candidatus Peribacteraceae bacterium]|nr:phosphoribosylglycinamide formyltransferase [Candidatus Peribacteraceae bacterium]